MATLTPEEITQHVEFDPADVDRVAHRVPQKVEIVEPRASWTEDFAHIETVIRKALGPVALIVRHVGSTSVPGLPAKPIIDVDLAVADSTDEASYVPALEAAGFVLLFREPKWYEHRFFGLEEPYANLHVFGPRNPEMERHRIFRDWLREHEDERENADTDRYAAIKREAAKQTTEQGLNILEYNSIKQDVLREILLRAFKGNGLLP